MHRSVQYPAWVPTIHPMSGQYQSVLRNVRDRLISDEEAKELRAWFELPATEEE